MAGQQCESFSSAEAALTYALRNPCDVVVTDIVMRGMEGLELTKQIKRVKPDVSIIVMTGFIDDFSFDRAIDAGASDFIKKPFTMHELLLRIKHVMMQKKLHDMSITDELTGLPNRRGFFAVAQQQMKLTIRTKGKVALLFADVDDFKVINDTWGHQQGDAALIAIADIFRKTFRDSDIVARMGGDEFAILLIDTPETNFSSVYHRLQSNLDEFNAAENNICKLSISVGLAVYDHEQPSTIDELLKQADLRMYEQKQRRKNIG